MTVRKSLTKDRPRLVNALNALVRSNDLSIDARTKPTATQITGVSRWRARGEELSVTIARTEAVRLAKHTVDLDEQLKANEKQWVELVRASESAPLLEETGFKAISAAKILTACPHEGRVRNEAAFASLTGATPFPPRPGRPADTDSTEAAIDP